MATIKFTNLSVYRQPEATEILVEDGKFSQIGSNLPDADETVDLDGMLVAPPYVDSHLHLDYVGTGRDDEAADNVSGTLFEGIERWSHIKKNQTIEDVKRRALRGIREEMIHGVQYIRTHIDVTDPELIGMQAMLELREELKDTVTIQIVSFPQEGMHNYPRGAELVEEGLKMGADVVGGIPHSEWARQYGEESVHKTVDLALKYDKLIDVHCDETDDPMSRFVELLNARVLADDYGPRTTASHTCSFGSVDDAYAFRMMGLFRKSGINFTAQGTENAYLQGRADTYPKRRGLTRVKEFLEEGINVSCGQDSIVDPWYPAGNGNLMNVLDNTLHLAQIMSFDDMEVGLDLITYNGAKTLSIEDIYGIEVGKDANFIVLNAPNALEAVRQRADVLRSVRRGKTIFQRSITIDKDLELPSI
ncbi:amidohydrolase family protein [Trueperella bialowiezensis]|uniref:Cytosine deaminase n=1 Tax=Trueperella bialowiezensis TaxID=312285 RepID=A0A3S4X6Z1_9ACTO|nr:amidohydrolase family protein [Trueperella bialowiezensis]VEI14009.1 Cytosine deaminase [Trueperella bialowiezensis]